MVQPRPRHRFCLCGCVGNRRRLCSGNFQLRRRLDRDLHGPDCDRLLGRLPRNHPIDRYAPMSAIWRNVFDHYRNVGDRYASGTNGPLHHHGSNDRWRVKQLQHHPYFELGLDACGGCRPTEIPNIRCLFSSMRRGDHRNLQSGTTVQRV